MSKRRPKLLAVAILSVVLMVVSASSVLANSEDDEGVDAIAITVIIPPLPERPAPIQQTPSTPRIFPINVAEGYNYEGVRELVRVYELLPGEMPEWINTDSFARNGYYYQIAEIIRRVDVAHTVREHTEVIEIPSATNNLQAVIAGLDPTMEFVDEDGYVGILHLDIRSIAMTQDGTRSTSRQVSQTREFPHLSNPDMALIPLTINVSGRTYNLADVDWRTNTSNPIDFNSVAQTFTAFATYTRTATSTVSTGYTTVAEYNGVLTRVSTGDMRFVATFIGTPIISPVVNRPFVPSPELESEPCEVTANGDDKENDYIGIEKPIGDISENANSNDSDDYEVNKHTEPETTAQDEPIQEPVDDEQNSSIPFLPIALALFALAIIGGLTAMCLKLKRKADVLQGKQHRNSANTLKSRMTSVIEQDRNELAAYEDDEEFVDLEDIEPFDADFEEFINDKDGENDD